MAARFSLKTWQVPEVPERGSNWGDWLRWMLCVMDHDDADLAFIAQSLGDFLRCEGDLPQDHRDRIKPVARRVINDFEAEALYCQFDIEPDDPWFDLFARPTEGEA